MVQGAPLLPSLCLQEMAIMLQVVEELLQEEELQKLFKRGFGLGSPPGTTQF